MKIKQVWLAILVLFIVACHGDQGTLPPTRPIGTVTGNAVAAAIGNAQIAVYALGRDGKGELLGTGNTNAQGSFSIDLQTPTQPVLIELSGGQYVEEASGISVDVADGQVLRAVAIYHSGQPLSVMVTPLTQIAAGLAQYRIANGKDPATAVDSAIKDVSQLSGVSVATVQPFNITDPDVATTQLTAPYIYGFFLAAISSFTQQVSQQNNVPVHTTYTSIGLAQVMYNDIVSDGLLDGRGYNKSGDTLMDLALGTVALNQDVYRNAIAQHLLAVSESTQNKTGLQRSDLLTTAQAVSNSTDVLFGTNPPGNKSAFAPVIVPVLAEGSAFDGINNFSVKVSSISGAASVSFTIDGTTIGDATDPANPSILINTRDYTTGTHVIGVTATDFLGNSAQRDFKYHFGNIYINVTSPIATNTSPFTITGNYDDQGGGFGSLTVQGTPVTPNADKTWSAQVDLTLGRNHIPIIFKTADGISDQLDAIVDYDVDPPIIDTSAGHGKACFSNGDGTCTSQVLSDNNNVAPIAIETDHTDLNGVAETRTALTDNNIPFFAFTANDAVTNGVNTPSKDIKVRFQYEKNGAAVVPWTVVTPANGEYILPLATELLSNAWLQSVPDDVHSLRIEAEDLAGNIASTTFTFKVEFVVAPFTIDSITDTGNGTISKVSFAQRSSLYNSTLTAVEYAFTNTTGKPFYISLSDTSIHTVVNLIDQLVRENSVRLQTSTEWRAGFIENALTSTGCPSMPKDSANNDKWTPVTQVLNYVGGGTWYPESVPAPTFGAIESVSTDTPTPPSPSSWTQIPDFDGSYASVSGVSISLGITISYQYDYILNSSQINQPAAIRKWVKNALGSIYTCPDVDFLQQRQVYSYQSEPGFPKNTASILSDTANFITNDFTVLDVSASSQITDVGGWYLIPANHAVVISKQVILPTLTVHNDLDVADPSTFTSYTPHLYDHTLTWTINRSMTIKAAPDGGPNNISYMSSRLIGVGTGTAIFQLTR